MTLQLVLGLTQIHGCTAGLVFFSQDSRSVVFICQAILALTQPVVEGEQWLICTSQDNNSKPPDFQLGCLGRTHVKNSWSFDCFDFGHLETVLNYEENGIICFPQIVSMFWICTTLRRTSFVYRLAELTA